MKKVFRLLFGFLAILLGLVGCIGGRLKPNLPVEVVETVDHDLNTLLTENQISTEQYEFLYRHFHQDIDRYQKPYGIPDFISQAPTFFYALECIGTLNVENPETIEKIENIAYRLYMAIARDSYFQLNRTLNGFPETKKEFHEWIGQYAYNKSDEWRGVVADLKDYMKVAQAYPQEQIDSIGQWITDFIDIREGQPDLPPGQLVERMIQVVDNMEEITDLNNPLQCYYLFRVVYLLDTYEYLFDEEKRPAAWKEFYEMKDAILTANKADDFYYGVSEQIMHLEKHEMITPAESKIMKDVMLSDIDDLCRKSKNKGDKEAIRKQLIKSLAKLKKLHLDTEDREFIVETYYSIAKQNSIDIGEELNIWMYGKLLNLLDKTMSKRVEND